MNPSLDLSQFYLQYKLDYSREIFTELQYSVLLSNHLPSQLYHICHSVITSNVSLRLRQTIVSSLVLRLLDCAYKRSTAKYKYTLQRSLVLDAWAVMKLKKAA